MTGPTTILAVMLCALPVMGQPAPEPLVTIFSSGMTREQASTLGNNPSLEQIAAELKPDQKQAVRRKLDAARTSASTREAVEEIARGFRILDGNSPDANSLADAVKLQAQDPNSSAGYTMAAGAYHGLGDYAAATEAAKKALKINPADRSALALLRASEGRTTAMSAASLTKTPAIATESPRDIDAIIAAAKSKPRSNGFGKEKGAPRIETFMVSGDEAAAPQATLWDRMAALISPDDGLVQEDISVLRAKARDFDLPPEIRSLATTMPEVPRQFVEWLKTMRPEDLPPIEYGILDPGDLAEYQRGLGRGKIVMSHFIRKAEPEARATALMHEVFHYWDMKIAKNPYGTESYGYTAPENIADREYDPYHLTARFWRHSRPNGAASAVARSLDRLPTETEDLRKAVDAIVERRRSKKR